MQSGSKGDVTMLGRRWTSGYASPAGRNAQGCGVVAQAHDASALSIGCEEHTVNNIVWWVGAIVIILAILGFLGFR
jgi:hypothetical protein